MGKHSRTPSTKWRVRGITFLGIHVGWGALEPGETRPAWAHRYDTWDEAFSYAFERASNRAILDRAQGCER